MTELTADVARAAEILHAHPVTVRELAASGRLRGRKVGRSWVFVVADLLAYIAAEVIEMERREAA